MFLKGKYIFGLFLFLIACKKDTSLWVIKNLSGNKINSLGHGGMGIKSLYPINSLKSLQNSLKINPDGVEIDICVTKDSVLVLKHSQDLDNETTCSGFINEKNWEEIKDCKYKLPLIGREDLIQASDFFDQVENMNELVFAFDCKIAFADDSEYRDLFVEALIRHLEKYKIVENSCIESGNVSFLKKLQAKDKKLKLFLYTENYQKALEVMEEVDLTGITINNENITAEEIKLAHQNNLKVALFNTQTEDQNLEAVEKSPDYIQTDELEHLVNVLK
jgi:glycerophosphoryl diester phosphodiesterase